MENKKQIDIDFDVYKQIILRSKYFEEPANEVLRRVFHVDSVESKSISKPENGKGPGLTVKNVFLPAGLKLSKNSGGKMHKAEVCDGYIEYENERYNYPSAAAGAATGNSVNGWNFWNYFDETDHKWKPLSNLRK